MLHPQRVDKSASGGEDASFEDIGVLFDGLLAQLLPVNLVVEAEGGGVVLTEGTVGHQEALAGDVGRHAVRPVQHGDLDRDQLTASEADLVAGLDGLEAPGLVEMRLDALEAPLGDHQGGPGCAAHHRWQASGMIHLGVVDATKSIFAGSTTSSAAAMSCPWSVPHTVSTRAALPSTTRKAL